MIQQIQILKDLIEGTLHRVFITDGSIVDNGDNTWTFSTCNTFYLNIGKTVVIDSVSYKITDFTLNSSLTVRPITGTNPVTASQFDIDSPIFKHGSPQLISNEFLNENTYPFIWLVQINKISNDGSFDSLVNSTMETNLMFLMDSNKQDWLIDDHYINAIYPLLNEINFFMNIIQKRVDLFGEEIDWDTKDHVNFGDYLTDQGNKKQIITDEVSGVLLQLDLPYVVEICNPCDTLFVCKPVTITKNGIFEEEVPSGGTFNYNTGGVCLDGTVIIEDENNTVLHTVPVASGGSVTQEIVDSNVANSDFSYGASIFAEGTLVLPDETYNIYVDGVLESSTTSPVLKNETINIIWQ